MTAASGNWPDSICISPDVVTIVTARRIDQSNSSLTAVLFKQIWLLFSDAGVERLELEPAGDSGADLLAGKFGVFVFDQLQFAGG